MMAIYIGFEKSWRRCMLNWLFKNNVSVYCIFYQILDNSNLHTSRSKFFFNFYDDQISTIIIYSNSKRLNNLYCPKNKDVIHDAANSIKEKQIRNIGSRKLAWVQRQLKSCLHVPRLLSSEYIWLFVYYIPMYTWKRKEKAKYIRYWTHCVYVKCHGLFRIQDMNVRAILIHFKDSVTNIIHS